MGVTWLNPWVWLGAVTVAVPIAIHLLARDRSIQRPFPSLRFVEPTPLSAVSRRTLQDVLLLALRIGIVLAAVAALAGPILITPGRQAAWASHVARAVVTGEQGAAAEDELRSARVGAVFSRARIRDSVRDATRWLQQQTPSEKEIVVLSSFQRGVVDPADFADVPADIGIRLVSTGEPPAVRERDITRLQLRGTELVRVTGRLGLNPADTSLTELSAERVDGTPIVVSAAPEDRAMADAALRAVLRRGVRLPPAGLLKPVEVAWNGDIDVLAADIARKLSAPLDAWEPERLTGTEMAAIERPVRAEGEGVPVDEGDRRPFWGMTLVLLALETWVRRGGAWT